MRVKVDPGIGVSAKTVGDLRKVTAWPENLAALLTLTKLSALRSRRLKAVSKLSRRPLRRTLVVKIILMIGAVLMLWSSNAAAQEEALRQRRVGHCIADLRKLCPKVLPGNNRLRACMREHIRDVSFPCLVALAKFAEVRRSLKGECSAHLQQQ